MKEKISAFLEQLRSALHRRHVERSPGFAPLPGQVRADWGRKLVGRLTALRIDWDKLYRKSFVYNSLAALVCAYFVADLLVAALTPWFPQSQAPRPRLGAGGERHDFSSYASLILPKNHPNLFNEKGLVPDNDEGAGNLNGPPVRTSLPLTLLGVIVVHDVKKSVASIEDKGQNMVIAVRVGEPITGDTLVQTITEDRVVFINNATGRREYIDLPLDAALLQLHHSTPKVSSDGITPETGGHVQIAASAMKTALGTDFGKILTQALCRPEMDSGKPIGYRCTEIEKDSVYEKLGLQNNDVVTSMDGEALTNMAPLMQKLNELREGRVQHLSITVLRNGQPVSTYFDLD